MLTMEPKFISVGCPPTRTIRIGISPQVHRHSYAIKVTGRPIQFISTYGVYPCMNCRTVCFLTSDTYAMDLEGKRSYCQDNQAFIPRTSRFRDVHSEARMSRDTISCSTTQQKDKDPYSRIFAMIMDDHAR